MAQRETKKAAAPEARNQHSSSAAEPRSSNGGNHRQPTFEDFEEHSGFIDHDDSDYEPAAPPRPSRPTRNGRGSAGEKRDAAIAELVDMGFSIEQATRALDHTEDGLNVRQAIDFIMTEAHRKATGQPMDEDMFRSRSSSSRSNRSDTLIFQRWLRIFLHSLWPPVCLYSTKVRRLLTKPSKITLRNRVP